jgi:hypothetical protein
MNLVSRKTVVPPAPAYRNLNTEKNGTPKARYLFWTHPNELI